MITFKNAEPSESDAKLVFSWRQDPVTVAMSASRKKPEWDYFLNQYLSYFIPVFLQPQFVVLKETGEKIGFLRFEPVHLPERPEEKCTEVMINIAAFHRGKGYGTRALFRLKSHPPLLEKAEFLTADIYENNEISRHVFEKSGFEQVSIRAGIVRVIYRLDKI